jgi:2-phospho-L-lactate guanylyltransferase (CobY/MobA/RfbA family)
VATYVIPYRPVGKTRLGDRNLADAMMSDVVEACRAAEAEDVIIVRAPGGQGEAIQGALLECSGPVTIVNSDLPCATAEELRRLTRAAPAIVPAADGTTNAIALPDARQFVPLYGPGSAARYRQALDADPLDLPGLRDDVDTWDDLDRLRTRVGPNTRRYLLERGVAA